MNNEMKWKRAAGWLLSLTLATTMAVTPVLAENDSSTETGSAPTQSTGMPGNFGKPDDQNDLDMLIFNLALEKGIIDQNTYDAIDAWMEEQTEEDSEQFTGEAPELPEGEAPELSDGQVPELPDGEDPMNSRWLEILQKLVDAGILTEDQSTAIQEQCMNEKFGMGGMPGGAPSGAPSGEAPSGEAPSGEAPSGAPGGEAPSGQPPEFSGEGPMG